MHDRNESTIHGILRRMAQEQEQEQEQDDECPRTGKWVHVRVHETQGDCTGTKKILVNENQNSAMKKKLVRTDPHPPEFGLRDPSVWLLARAHNMLACTINLP
jgi:hypothetical protein